MAGFATDHPKKKRREPLKTNLEATRTAQFRTDLPHRRFKNTHMRHHCPILLPTSCARLPFSASFCAVVSVVQVLLQLAIRAVQKALLLRAQVRSGHFALALCG